MKIMAVFLLQHLGPLLIWGLVTSSVYLLMATGLTLIFGTLRLVNFAHGDLIVLSAFITFLLTTNMNLNPFIALIPAMFVVMTVGVAIYRFGFKPIYGISKVSEILMTIGISYIIENAMAYYFLPVYRTSVEIPSPVGGGGVVLPGNVLMTYDMLETIVVSWVLMIILYYWLYRTGQGIAIRALSQNPVGASISGVDVGRLSYVIFLVGSALAAVAGALYGILYTFWPYNGIILTLMAFSVMILGGVGSIPGTMIASLVMGYAVNFASYYLGGCWGEAISFIILALVLLVRPSGIFRGG